MTVHVAVPVPGLGLLTYSVPAGMARPVVGARVVVPLGSRVVTGIVMDDASASTVAEVKASGERAALRPMTPFERKVVHDAVAAAGLSSESEGEEPRRYVVVLPA